MTEQDLTATASEAVDTDFGGGFFDEWIGGASAARRSVPIYGKPHLYAEIQEIQRQLDIERKVAADGGGDEMGGSPISKLEAQEQSTFDEWKASATLWVVEALPDDAQETAEAKLAAEGHPKPTAPEGRPVQPMLRFPEIAETANEQQRKAHQRRLEQFNSAWTNWGQLNDQYKATDEYKAYDKALDEWATAMNNHLIVTALVHIKDEAGNIRQTSITADRLSKMAVVLGKAQLEKLVNAITDATVNESEIEAPFSRANSEAAQTS